MDREKEFLSTISHEIRTPLTSIKGFSKTILDSYDSLGDEQKKRFIKIILEQSQRLINLVENALTAADSDVEYNNLVFKKVDINSVLKKSIELVNMNYKDKKFKTNLAPNLFSALDKDKTEQVFVNILDNAAKYSVNSDTIEVQSCLKGGFVCVSVKNFGIEIDKNEQTKIFEKFYRSGSYLTSKTQGSGLGLYIVKLLVEKMNGKISVESKNSSVEFILSFPVFGVEEFTKGAKVV